MEKFKKIIDKNGKVFGKINIIDLVIIIVLFLLILWGINSLFFTAKPKVSTIYIQMQVCEEGVKNCGEVPLYYLDSVKKGDNILLENEKKKFVIGEIIDKYGLQETDDDAETSTVDMGLILKLNVSEIKGDFLFNSKKIKLKEIIDISTEKTTISGVIMEFDRNLSSVELKYYEKEVEIFLEEQPVEITMNIKKGDKELGPDDEIIAEIIEYKAYSSINPNKDVILKANLRTLFLDNSYWFKGRKLKIGEKASIETDRTILTGKIISLGDDNFPRLEQIVIIKMYNQPEFIAEKIMIGDKEIDNKGMIIGKILSKKVENAKRELTTENGSLVLAESPVNKDITLEVLLTVEKKQDELFFHRDSLKIGKWIYLSLEKMDISGNVVDIG